jgi:Protein kinase domain.
LQKFRSPEELNGDWQTEKVDVFSLGYIIYSMITEDIPFKEYNPKEIHRMMRDGHLPAMGIEILRSNHPVDKVLMDAMNMCFEFNWRKRARASEVLDFLIEEMEQIKRNYERHNH